MRVLAVLTGLVLGAAPHKQGQSRAIEIADTMSSALAKMVGGVEHFLAEARDSEAERSAHAFIGDRKQQVTQQDVDAAEDKGLHLADQVLRNLKALTAAAKALQGAAREAPPPMSEGKKDGYVMALENKVAGQKRAIADLNEEKQSLVTSVASLMHRGADTDLKSQIADARAKIVQLEEAANAAAKAAARKASGTEDELRNDNQLLSQSLTQCQSEKKAAGEGKVEESVVTTEVKCKVDLAEAAKKLADVEAEHDSLVQTVDLMVKSSDELKAQLLGKANCTVAPPPTAPAPKAFDVAHMADTVKIDQYIATAGHPTTARALEPIKPVHFQAKSVKAAAEALAGRGDIGKYLRGAKDDNAESKAGASAALAAADTDTNDLEQQIDSLMPEDVDVLKAADAVGAAKKPVRKQAHDDNLAQKLLLQAEQTLKLAA